MKLPHNFARIAFAPFAFVASVLWLALAPSPASAQPTPPASQSVTATTSTGALVSPSNFFTGNSAAIVALLGNATISGNVTIPVGSTLTINGAATGTPTGGTLNLSNVTVTLPSGVAQSGTITATAIADPSTPPTNRGYVFYDTTHHNYNLLNDAGVTFNMVIPTTATANQFVTAIGRSGTITTARPSAANLSDGTTGTGAVVLGTGPTITLGNATGLPLTTGVTGTLGAGNGGTGLSSVGTSGNVLTSNGTAWVSSAPAASTSIFGTANQITASAATGNVTLTIPSAFTFPGNATLGTGNYFNMNGTAVTIYGSSTQGGRIFARGTAPDESLIVRGTTTYTYNQSMNGVIDLQDTVVINTARSTTAASVPMLVNSGATLQVTTANRFGYTALEAASITGSGNVTSSGGALISFRPGIATTSTTGLQLANTTASTSGVTVQYSPRVLFTGHAWNTTVTQADNYLEAINELRPASSGTPTSTLAWGFRRSTDGATGSFTDGMTLSDSGVMRVPQGTTAGLFNSTNTGHGFYVGNGSGPFVGTSFGVGVAFYGANTYFYSTSLMPANDGAADTVLGASGNRWLQLYLSKTVTAGGTTGAQTINKPVGSVNFAAAATSLVVTNSLVSTSSVIIATVGTNDTTMKSVQVVAGSGSFTIYANAAATAETRVNFLVLN